REEPLAKIFLEQMERVENYMKTHAQFSCLSVNYNELVTNPAPQVAAIDSFLGDLLDKEKMIRAVDSQLYRQRKHSVAG
ncbi:MAG: hypothetical protein ABJC04_04850, partial [Verrucomicrobiota bacterium]